MPRVDPAGSWWQQIDRCLVDVPRAKQANYLLVLLSSLAVWLIVLRGRSRFAAFHQTPRRRVTKHDYRADTVFRWAQNLHQRTGLSRMPTRFVAIRRTHFNPPTSSDKGCEDRGIPSAPGLPI